MQFRFSLSYQLTKILQCSHKDAVAFCRKGQILVDQSPETNPRRILGIHEEIRLNEVVIRKGKSFCSIAFYKPPGFECTANRAIENNIYTLLPPEYQDLFSLGRLDTNSEGLLLLTNDGRVYRQIMTEEAKIEKEYLVHTHFPISKSLEEAFTRPFLLGQRWTLPAHFEQIGDFCFKVILTEGINRQIRRICAKNGNQVRQLIRIRFGEQKLGNMKIGEWRALTSIIGN